MGTRRPRAGDRVVVRSPEEILSTLGPDGTTGGLPFMPEMLDWCGGTFRVQRRVVKTCISAAPPARGVRRFAADDVVMLEGPRCDGRAHDGCKRGCRIFWKEAWLRPADAAETGPPASEAALAALRSRLKVKADQARYFCQSTELHRATEDFPGRLKPWMVRVAIREILDGDRSLAEMSKLLALWSWQKLRRALAGESWLRGPHRRTPSRTLDLKPGDIVRVKSREDIVATLDERRRNRGMGICYEVTRCCGREAEVRSRVDRIIDERTGEMREIQDTVALQRMRGTRDLGEECLCYDALGDCPRGEMMFWREIWLERADGGGS